MLEPFSRNLSHYIAALILYNHPMKKRFLTSCLLLVIIVSGCSPKAPATEASIIFTPELVSVRYDASGVSHFASQSTPSSPVYALPFTLPQDCSIYNLYPNPAMPVLAVEYFCGGGPEVIFYDLQSKKSYNPAGTLQTDSRFLTWSSDGSSLYLKTDTSGNPQIVRFDRYYNRLTTLALPEMVYDMAALPDGRILYSFTKGIGYGSETWVADADGRHSRQILAEPQGIIAYLRPSPDGSRIAFILMPDSQTPFTVGSLWVAEADGSNPRTLAEADAGHGYAPAWSPDGTQIAFVARENPGDPSADQFADKLISNVYRVEVETGKQTSVSSFETGMAETPSWSPDGAYIIFNLRRNGTIQAWVDNAGNLQPLSQETACCAVWVPGR
jgi:hypothetical protein